MTIKLAKISSIADPNAAVYVAYNLDQVKKVCELIGTEDTVWSVKQLRVIADRAAKGELNYHDAGHTVTLSLPDPVALQGSDDLATIDPASAPSRLPTTSASPSTGTTSESPQPSTPNPNTGATKQPTTTMKTTEKLECIRRIANEMLSLIDSEPLAQPMAWMITPTPEEHAATIASDCAKLANEVVNIVID